MITTQDEQQDSGDDERERSVVRDNPVPVPPFWGGKCLEHIPLRAVVPYINRRTLYHFQWGFKAAGRSNQNTRPGPRRGRSDLQSHGRARRAREASSGRRESTAISPAESEGRAAIVYHEPTAARERCHFVFPRQNKARRLCIADFFRSVDSGQMDVVGFQLATVGQHASDFARELFGRDQYQEYLYLHGLNVETTEGLAEFVHKRIRAELGFSREDARVLADMLKQGYRGSRYSFGYPACPNLADQDKILELLDAQRIGVTLGDEDQLWPEESTSAIVVHHPQARYFSA